MLTDPFVDFDDGRDYRDTDLSKRLLSLFEVDREEFGTRIATVKSKTTNSEGSSNSTERLGLF
jgi:hypothetical protein